MKKLFYPGLLALGLFEILKVYFIMPMPGSQQMNTIDIAYFMHHYRWLFRIAFALMIVAGSTKAFRIKRPWIPAIPLLLVSVITWYFNFKMTADQMFLQPGKPAFSGRSENAVPDSSVVITVSHEGIAKAYPIRYLAYHHQVRDTVGNKAVMVTYCNVCRTGRVFEPVVNGQPEEFRLVGMDHFNAMFEDATTKSWWQQATGEAITGQLKGHLLPELESGQMTVNKFFTLYPFGEVMQPDESSTDYYDTLGRFERGKSKGKLTRTDSLSWKDKSWVIGINVNGHAKAYDWNELKKQGIIHDVIDTIPIVIALSQDSNSYVAVRRNSPDQVFVIRNDSLITSDRAYDLAGRGSDGARLQRINAYQEFWHSWRTFHPNTSRYGQ